MSRTDEYRRNAEEADAMARECLDAAARTIYEDGARRLREAAEQAGRGGALFAELCASLFGMGKYILCAVTPVHGVDAADDDGKREEAADNPPPGITGPISTSVPVVVAGTAGGTGNAGGSSSR
jgi:hypothetical protein